MDIIGPHISNSNFKGTQLLLRHFQKQNTSISTSCTGGPSAAPRLPRYAEGLSYASSSMGGNGTFSHLRWCSTPELGSNCPKNSKIHCPVDNYCLCGRAHTSVCLHSVAPVPSSTPQWFPKHIPFAQLCYRGHTCCQRECLGEQGGLNTGDCYISSLQGSKAYQTCCMWECMGEYLQRSTPNLTLPSYLVFVIWLDHLLGKWWFCCMLHLHEHFFHKLSITGTDS